MIVRPFINITCVPKCWLFSIGIIPLPWESSCGGILFVIHMVALIYAFCLVIVAL